MNTKFISVSFVVLAVIIVGALVAPSFIDWNKYKPEIAKQVYDKTGLTVDLDGAIKLSVLPLPHLSIMDVAVKNGDDTLVTLKEAEVSVELLPLLSKTVNVRNVDLIEPVITVSVDAQGKGNWETEILANAGNASAETEVEATSNTEITPSSSQEEAAAFSISSLEITQGKLVYADKASGSATTVSDINMRGKLDSLTGPFDLKGSYSLNDMPMRIDANIGDISNSDRITVKGDLTLSDLDTNLNFDGLVDVEKQAIAGKFSAEGKDLGKLGVSDVSGGFGASGNINASSSAVLLDNFEARFAQLIFKGSVKGTDIDNEKSKALSLNLKETSGKLGEGTIGQVLSGSTLIADINILEKAVSFPSFNVSAQGTRISGNGRYDFSPARLSLTAKSPLLDIDALTKSISTSASSGSATSSSSSSTKGNNSEFGFALPMALVVDMSVDKLVNDAIAYSDVRVNISGQGDALKITQLNLSAPYDTKISVKGSIGNTQNLTGLDIQSSLKTSDIVSFAKLYSSDIELPVDGLKAVSADASIKGNLNTLSFSVKGQGKGATVSASGVANDPMGDLALSGLELRVQHPNMVQAIQIVQSDFDMERYWQKPIDIKTAFEMKGDVLTVQSLSGSAGPVPLKSANLSINTSGDVPKISGTVALGSLVLPATSGDTSKASNTSGGSNKSSGSKPSAATWSSDVIDASWMRSAFADLDISADAITQNKWVLTKPKLDFELSNGTLNVSSLSAGMFGGSVNMNGKIVAANDNNGFASASWASKATNLNAQSLYQALTSSNSALLSGQISNFEEDVTTSGRSVKALIDNLNGEMTLNGQNVIVKGIDITGFAKALGGSFKPKDRAATLLDSSLYGGQTEFTTITGKFPISKGVVSFLPLALDGPKALFDVKGQVSLPAWRIDAVNTITVKNTDIPPFDLKLEGSLDNPKKTASSVLEGYLESKIREKVSEYLIDEGIADKINNKLGIPLFGGQQKTGNELQDGGENTQQIDPEKAIRGALEGLFR